MAKCIDRGFTCLMTVDVSGKMYVAECPVEVAPGLIAEIGQMVGVIKDSVYIQKCSNAYQFICAMAGEVHQVSTVYQSCWNAKSFR